MAELLLEYLDPASLTPQPANPWSHPPAQAGALAAAIDQAGWAGAALLNRRTGKLIDGHLRREEAIRRGERLPTLVGEWDEAQERLLLATVNPIAALAEQDDARLSALLASVREDTAGGLLAADERLDALLESIAANRSASPPEEFPEYDEDIETDYHCPRCGYEWSGKPE
jgi:hypothetical protein